MNETEQLLTELRRISAWTDLQRKITKWSAIAVCVFIPSLIVFAVVMDSHFQTRLKDINAPEPPRKLAWTDVDYCIRRGEPDEAIKIGQELIRKTPLYPDGHHRLALAYLEAGKVQEAREHFAEAFRLFPTDENERLLKAIEKRRASGETVRP